MNTSSKTKIGALSLVLAMGFALPSGRADTFTWLPSLTSGTWGVAASWTNSEGAHVVPGISGTTDDVVTGTNATNDINVSATLNSLTLNALPTGSSWTIVAIASINLNIGTLTSNAGLFQIRDSTADASKVQLTVGNMNLTGGNITLGNATADITALNVTGTTTINSGNTLSLAIVNSATAFLGTVVNNGNITFGILPSALQTTEAMTSLTGSGTITTGGGTLGSTNTALLIGPAQTSTFSGVIKDNTGTNALSLTIAAGSGTQVLSGSNSYSGATTINAGGALQLGAGGASGSVSGNILDNGSLAFNRSDAATYSGVVSGSGGLQTLGSGTTILTGANIYTGATTIASGATLQIGNGTVNGSVSGSSAITDNGTLALKYVTTSSTSFNNAISGSGGLTLITGTVSLGGVNTYNGTTTINGGSLIVGNALALQNTTVDIEATNALVFGSTGTYTVGAIGGVHPFAGPAGASSGNFTVIMGGNNASTALTAGALSIGGGNIVKAGTGTFSFSSVSNLNANIGVNGGVFQLTGTGGVNSGTITIGNTVSGTFFSNNVTLGGGTFAINEPLSMTFSNTVTGSGNFAVNGAGTITVSAANTFTGATAISTGVLQAGSSTALGNAGNSLSITSGGTLDLNGNSITVGTLNGDSSAVVTSGTAGAATFTAGSSANSIYSGVIQNGLGTVSFTKNGSGALTLAGANTYTGATVIGAGSLLVSGGLSSSTAVTVANGATLGLSGAATGGTTLSTLTVNSLTLNTSSTGLESIIKLDLKSAGASDKIALGTGLTLNGTGTINLVLTDVSGGSLFDGSTYTLLTWASGSPGIALNQIDLAGSSADIISAAPSDLQISGNSLVFVTASVPEPGTWGLLAVSFGMMLLVCGKRRAKLAVRTV